METEDFKAVVRERLQAVEATLIAKACEYARGDRLSNFKQIAHLMNVTPEKAIAGLVSKHIVALYDFINDLEAGLFQPYERWNEKIGDVMAYMCLLDAMIQDRRSQQHGQVQSPGIRAFMETL